MVHHALRAADAYSVPDIAYVGCTSSSNGTFALPTGLQQHDIVILISTNDDYVDYWPLPSGYTYSDMQEDAVYTRIVWKRMGATPDSYVYTQTLSAGVHLAMAFRNCYRNQYILGSPFYIDAYGVAGRKAPDPPALNISKPRRMMVVAACQDDDIITNATAPSGYTLIASVAGGVAGAGNSLMAAYKLITTTGTEDPGVFGVGGILDENIAYSMALNPLGAPGYY